MPRVSPASRCAPDASARGDPAVAGGDGGEGSAAPSVGGADGFSSISDMMSMLAWYAEYQAWLLEEIVYATNPARHLESLADNRERLRQMYGTFYGFSSRSPG